MDAIRRARAERELFENGMGGERTVHDYVLKKTYSGYVISPLTNGHEGILILEDDQFGSCRAPTIKALKSETPT